MRNILFVKDLKAKTEKTTKHICELINIQIKIKKQKKKENKTTKKRHQMTLNIQQKSDSKTKKNQTSGH